MTNIERLAGDTLSSETKERLAKVAGMLMVDLHRPSMTLDEAANELIQQYFEKTHDQL